MTKQEALTKFNRISNDPRQAQAFVQDLLDGKLIDVGTKLYKHVLNCQTGMFIKLKLSGGTELPLLTGTFTFVSTSNEKSKFVERDGKTVINVYGKLIFSQIIRTSICEVYLTGEINRHPTEGMTLPLHLLNLPEAYAGATIVYDDTYPLTDSVTAI